MRRRLLLSYLTVTVVVLMLLVVPLGIFYAQRERERVTAALGHDAAVIATLYEDDLERGRSVDPRPAVEYRGRTGARVVVTDRNGVSLIDTDQAVNRDFSTRPEFAKALAGTRSSGTRSSETLQTDLVYVAVPVASGGTVHGALRLTVDTSDVTARIRRFWMALGAVAAVVVGAVALIGWWIAGSVSRPIHRLNAAASRFASGDLTVNDEPASGPPEVRALAGTLAVMAQRLDDLLRTQRRFVADASHQLRTPLTALRLRLENLQSRLPAESAEELDAAIEETARLAALVTQLLQLARADEHPEIGVADLAQLALDRVDTWSAAAPADGVRVVADTPPGPVQVQAVHGAIEQILDNLLDNAFNASPPGGTVTARVSAAPGGGTLTIADEGPGLSDEEKIDAVQRFWRGNTATPGTGLGLAIVEALATACGATLQLGDAPGGGLAVTVTFRAGSPSPS